MKKITKRHFASLSIIIIIIFCNFLNSNPQLPLNPETSITNVSRYNTLPEQPDEKEEIIIAP